MLRRFPLSTAEVWSITASCIALPAHNDGLKCQRRPSKVQSAAQPHQATREGNGQTIVAGPLPVDVGGDCGQLCDEVERVLQHGAPVLRLADALGIGCRKLAAWLQVHNEAVKNRARSEQSVSNGTIDKPGGQVRPISDAAASIVSIQCKQIVEGRWPHAAPAPQWTAASCGAMPGGIATRVLCLSLALCTIGEKLFSCRSLHRYLQRQHGNGQLRHGVRARRQRRQRLRDVRRQGRPRPQLP